MVQTNCSELGFGGKKILALSVGLTVNCVVVFFPLSSLAQDQAPPPPAVTVAPVVAKNITPSIDFVGRIEAIESVDIRARVEGFLLERLFEEGADIGTGETLYRIEPDSYQAEVDRLLATVDRAKAALDLANIEQDRQQTLVERDAVAQSQLDEAIAKADEARADMRMQEADLEKARLDLGYTEVSAPITGRIGRTIYSVGDFVGPGSGTLVTIDQLNPIYARVNVSEAIYLDVRRGRTEEGAYRPRLRLSNGEMYGQDGTFAFAAPRVDASTDTVAVRFQFENPDAILLPEQFVTVVIETAEPVDAIVVPQTAVQEDQAGSFVLVVTEDNKAEMARVTLGDQMGIDWVVEEGLSAGQMVITEGMQKVRPGMVVTPQSAAGDDDAVSEGGVSSEASEG